MRLGRELRTQRLSLGLSQEAVATAARIERCRYSRLENARLDLTVAELYRLGAALELDAFVRLYPGGSPLRDGAHARKLAEFLAHARRPLTCRTEVPLPAAQGRLERRAWDAVLAGGSERTAIELEMRLYDAQAQERRISLKRRDEQTDHFLLLVADTRTNRQVLREQPELFRDLPKLRPARVRAALAAGRHPGSGLLFA